MTMTNSEIEEKKEWVEQYLNLLHISYPALSAHIAYVDILEDGTLNFVTQQNSDASDG